MFASGSKSSGGSRGFSLDWLEKYSLNPAASSSWVADFYGVQDRSPCYPRYFCYPRGQ
jgi:hypothetical protein